MGSRLEDALQAGPRCQIGQRHFSVKQVRDGVGVQGAFAALVFERRCLLHAGVGTVFGISNDIFFA